MDGMHLPEPPPGMVWLVEPVGARVPLLGELVSPDHGADWFAVEWTAGGGACSALGARLWCRDPASGGELSMPVPWARAKSWRVARLVAAASLAVPLGL